MNLNVRNSSVRHSSAFSRHVTGNPTLGRSGHHSRWPMSRVTFTKDYHNGYPQGGNERNKDMLSYPKPNGTPNSGHYASEGSSHHEMRPLNDSVHNPHRPTIPDPSLSILNPPMLGLNPSLLGAGPLESQISVEYPQIRQQEIRSAQVSPTASFFRPNLQDDGRKSESPSRKRRRIVQNVSNPGLGMSYQQQQPVPWEQRRNTRVFPRNSAPLRRPRFREWVPEGHPVPRLQHPPTFTHPAPPHPQQAHHTPPLVMDVTQVPVSLTLPIYPSGPSPAHIPPCQLHSIYCTTPATHTCQLNGFGGCINHHSSAHHHHHHHPGSALSFLSTAAAAAAVAAAAHSTLQPLTHVHYPPHLPPRPESIEVDIIVDHHHRSPPRHAFLQVPTPPSIFISEVPRRTNPRRRRNPLPPTAPIIPGWVHFLAMFSNPPLSPYTQDLGGAAETHHSENYEELLSLAERLGEAKPRGLNKLEIEQLPSYKFNLETHQSDQTSCVVCMCDFEARQMLRALPCSHHFHAKCVDKWLKTNRTCPICRGDASGCVINPDKSKQD